MHAIGRCWVWISSGVSYLRSQNSSIFSIQKQFFKNKPSSNILVFNHSFPSDLLGRWRQYIRAAGPCLLWLKCIYVRDPLLSRYSGFNWGFNVRLLGYKICLDTKLVLYQDRFCIFYRSYKTGFVPKRVNTKPVLYQILRLKPRYGLLNPNPDSHTLPLRQLKYLFKMKRQV